MYTQPQKLLIDEVGYLPYSYRHADLLVIDHHRNHVAVSAVHAEPTRPASINVVELALQRQQAALIGEGR